LDLLDKFGGKKTPACKGIKKQAPPKKKLLIMEKKTTILFV
jgi:hypothetical protein